MKTGAIIGGIIGLCVGVVSLIWSNFPQFLFQLFLGGVYEKILPYGDLGEALGWLYFIFSTLVGVLYGFIIALLVKKINI